MNTWRQMVEIDKVIDNNGTPELVKELARLRIRNRQAFNELQSLNDKGKFVYKHPLIKNFSEREQLKEMMIHRPEEFLKEYSNTRDNVKRYASFINRKNRSAAQKKKDKQNLEKHREKELLMQDILKESNGNN